MKPILAIAAPARAEAPYLLEWIAYHRVLGIQMFLIADNGGDDGTSDLLRRLDHHRVIVRIDWSGQRYFQIAFLRQAIEQARAFAGGLFLIDVDEFIRPLDGATSITEVAQLWMADDAVGAVAINWAIYGSSGHQAAEDGLVIERFTKRAPQDCPINKHVKSFVRADRCAGPTDNPHAVDLARGRYIDAAGKDVRWDASVVAQGITTQVVWNRIRIDHFVVKSREEFERKRARGSVRSPDTEAQRGGENYFHAHDRNEVSDPMPEPLVRATRAEMVRLRTMLEG
jgi:hypothetical protein